MWRGDFIAGRHVEDLKIAIAVRFKLRGALCVHGGNSVRALIEVSIGTEKRRGRVAGSDLADRSCVAADVSPCSRFPMFHELLEIVRFGVHVQVMHIGRPAVSRPCDSVYTKSVEPANSGRLAQEENQQK